MNNKMTVFKNVLIYSLSSALLLFSFGCGSRNIYKNAIKTEPPLVRGYVYHTRDFTSEAGAEPVEFASPMVSKNTVYVGSETFGLEAFERSSFKRKWQFKTKNGVGSELLLTDNAVYFGSNDGQFYAVDPDFGKLLWKYETKAPVFSKATVKNGKIYISASDDVLYCLEEATGKWLWHYKRGGNYITTVRGNSTAAVDGDTVYVGFSDGYLTALGANDGNLRWELKIHKGTKFTDVDAMPLIDGDRLYIASYDGELHAVNKKTGQSLWKVDIGGSKKALLDDKLIYIGSSNGMIYALNKESGRVLWKFELDDGTPTGLLQYQNYLVFGSSRQYFYTIHKGDGSLAYRFNVGLRSGFMANPVQDEKDVYIFSNFGNLYVFQWQNNSKHGRQIF